ncbi:hypothetical protein Poli38472_005013 [Pythium oligandrum]|uniref:Myb/SANT-like domain-containing protein n=1 Tax=Pythium oligandrum TaxID=41045 RepID=A0A8K1CBE1_PYTOL|nr:hypothetical protein Poli38472_005013 [Pythium oligandrum]|eukprot:TMW59944.1 hypothetical protein Poli38472_005013 [Pythium oligandrum]
MLKPMLKPMPMRNGAQENEAARLAAARAQASARYSWNDDPEKTRCLIALVNESLAAKKENARYIPSTEWEVIMDKFNRVAPEPVENIKILHNRIAILRAQCKEYHEVASAGRLDDAAWQELLTRRPALKKWRHHEFEFYREMAAFLALTEGQEASIPSTVVATTAESDESSSSSTHIQPNAEPGVTLQGSPGLLGRRRESASSSSPYRRPRQRARRDETPSTPVTVVPPPPPPQTAYPQALEQLQLLQLPLDDRVDAKRFLVDERNAKVFIHMDQEEQRAYLSKYCFEQRDSNRRYQFE